MLVDYCTPSVLEYCRKALGVKLADGKKRYAKFRYKECLNTYSIQLHDPLLPGMYFILVSQLDGHISFNNRVLLKFSEVIAIVMGGSGVNGPDP